MEQLLPERAEGHVLVIKANSRHITSQFTVVYSSTFVPSVMKMPQSWRFIRYNAHHREINTHEVFRNFNALLRVIRKSSSKISAVHMTTQFPSYS